MLQLVYTCRSCFVCQDISSTQARTVVSDAGFQRLPGSWLMSSSGTSNLTSCDICQGWSPIFLLPVTELLPERLAPLLLDVLNEGGPVLVLLSRVCLAVPFKAGLVFLPGRDKPACKTIVT